MRVPASIKVVVLALVAAWVGITLASAPTPALRTKENIARGSAHSGGVCNFNSTEARELCLGAQVWQLKQLPR
jgi:hypothetical protein